MIRIRDKKGEIVRQNDDDSFIELCNKDGDLVAVFYEKQTNGEIYQLMSDSEMAKKYEEAFNVKFLTKKINYDSKKSESNS